MVGFDFWLNRAASCVCVSREDGARVRILVCALVVFREWNRPVAATRIKYSLVTVGMQKLWVNHFTV